MESLRSFFLHCSRYIAERPGVLVALFIGLAAGVLLRLPLIPWSLDANSATVIGSALGALIGAGAAALIASSIANKTSRDSRRTVEQVVLGPLRAVGLLIAHAVQNQLNFAAVEEKTSALASAVAIAKRRLETLQRSPLYQAGDLGLCVADALHLINLLDIADYPAVRSSVEQFRNTHPSLRGTMNPLQPDVLLRLQQRGDDLQMLLKRLSPWA